MMKNKIFLTILYNIIILLVLLFFLDLCFVYYKNNSYIIKNGFRLLPHTEAHYSEFSRDAISGPAIPDTPTNKRPVIFSGCSIAHGHYLIFEQTIGYLVSKLSNRKVYNRGMSSTCISHVLYELTETNYYDKTDNPEYLFFIYAPALHSNRINAYVYNDTSQIEYLRYKLKNNKLTIRSGHNIPFISALSLYRHLQFQLNYNSPYTDYNKALTIALFKEVNKQIHMKFPDIHFIVILYEVNMTQNDFNSQYYKDIFQALKSDGIEVISINEMIGDDSSKLEYKLDQSHPNNIVWERVSKKLVEKYTL